MVVVDPPHDDPVAALSDELPGGDDDPLAFLNLDDPAPELVAAAGKEGEEEDLANKDAFPTLDTTAPAEVVAAGGKDGERWNELPGGGDIFQDFLDDVTPKVVAAGGKDGDEEELPWLTNKDAFQGDSVPWASFPGDIPSDDEYLLALLHDDVAPKLVAPGGKDGDKEEQLWLTNKDAFPTLDTMAPAEAGAAAARSPTPPPPPRRRTPVVVVDVLHSDPVILDTMAPAEDRAKAARPRRKCVRGLGAAAERSPTPPPPPRRRTPVVVVDALHSDPVPVAALLDELPGGNDVAPKVVAAGGKDGDEEELPWLANKGAFPTLDTMALPDAGAQAARPRRKCVRPLGAAARSPTPPSPPRLRAPAKEKRQCEHCGTDETPQWRKGPEGRPTLCNACGMRFKKGKLLPEYRPLKSPTFSPDLHTNRHRRVLDMARRQEEEEAKASAADATSGD